MYILISSLLKPLILFYILAVSASLFYFFKRKRWFRITFCLAILWFLIISTPFIPDALVATLEGKAKKSDTLPSDFARNHLYIMVLGGGHISDLSLSANKQLSKNALGRLAEGIRLYNKYTGSKLILSGWGQTQPLTQAQTLALAALDLGIPVKDMILFNEPRNTSEEAKCFEQYATSGTSLIIVTDAVHISRALSHFHNNNINPYVSPCNFIFKQNNNKSFSYYLPSSDHIAKSEIAMHEYIGILVSYF